MQRGEDHENYAQGGVCIPIVLLPATCLQKRGDVTVARQACMLPRSGVESWERQGSKGECGKRLGSLTH